MLLHMLPSLPPSEKKIAEFIMTHPEQAIRSTAYELGQRSSTSSAAVIRLCKSLGLKGFQELKLKITGDLQKPMDQGYRDIQPFESQEAVIQKMTNNSIQTLKETAEIINIDELSGAVEALIKAKSIHFFGIGASNIIAADAQQKFLRINKNATAFTDTHVVATLVANASKNDVIVGISFSGETAEVAKILELANKKGLTAISLTKYGSSIVSERADIKLFTSYSKEPTFRSGATSSRLAQLHLIDILFMCVATQQYDETVQYLDSTKEAITYYKEHGLKKRQKNEQ
ncbi:MurR/RpiR family transcriptional regulator [Fictibacillus sp. B-59209]|uniref:MurR/RpiR family transcriptional regulator n=1 Tax=Fictibacillus sp. B-59209 TaxID=3024873 RepID=UPI002E21A719|nr:MurR/RpiR family transcriptional regulator [Fictibacillus sp. B-59209]